MSAESGRLRPGSLLWLQDGRGDPVAVKVLEVEEGAILIDPGDAVLSPETPVLLEHRVSGDARYRATAELEIDALGRAVLLPHDGWQRDNRRAYVRVRTYGITARVIQPLHGVLEARSSASSLHSESDDECAVLDVSAGGLSLRAEPRFASDDDVICHFELPGEACFALPGRVVRADTPPEGRVLGAVAIEFVGLDEANRAALTRWVFREQARRRRP